MLKISHADRIYTKHGKEIKGFSHLRNDFKSESTFIVSAGPAKYRYLEDEDNEDEDADIGRGNDPADGYESSDSAERDRRGTCVYKGQKANVNIATYAFKQKCIVYYNTMKMIPQH